MNRAQGFKDAARALSLANLFFIGAWMPLIDSSFNQRLKYTLFNFNNLLALILNVVLLGAIFFGGVTLARVLKRDVAMRVAHYFLLLACFALIGLHLLSRGMWVQSVGYFNPTELRVITVIGMASFVFLVRSFRWRWVVAAVAAGLLAWGWESEYTMAGLTVSLLGSGVLIRWCRQMVRAAAAILLLLFPFVLMLFLQNFWLIYKLQNQTSPPLVAKATSPTKRLVWLIFDEMDYRAAFVNSPRAVELPEFTRLEQQSLVASNAYPPADSTMLSLPAFITGRLVDKAKPVHSSELLLNFADSDEYVAWSALPNVFSKARELGANSGMVGWYHPYKRMIGHTLNRCVVSDADALTLPVSMLLNLNRALEHTSLRQRTMPLAGILARLSRQRHIESYNEIMAESKSLVADPELSLVFIHLPVPHPPGIYNRQSSEFEYEAESSYFDNLALADQTLGELRRAMEEAGLWEESAVLVTSDHWWRPAIWQSLQVWTEEDQRFSLPPGQLDYRVPFLLKMPGQSAQIAHDAPFNTVYSQELILEILQGRVPDIGGVKQWFEGKGSVAAAPHLWDQSED